MKAALFLATEGLLFEDQEALDTLLLAVMFLVGFVVLYVLDARQ